MKLWKFISSCIIKSTQRIALSLLCKSTSLIFSVNITHVLPFTTAHKYENLTLNLFSTPDMANGGEGFPTTKPICFLPKALHMKSEVLSISAVSLLHRHQHSALRNTLGWRLPTHCESCTAPPLTLPVRGSWAMGFISLIRWFLGNYFLLPVLKPRGIF